MKILWIHLDLIGASRPIRLIKRWSKGSANSFAVKKIKRIGNVKFQLI